MLKIAVTSQGRISLTGGDVLSGFGINILLAFNPSRTRFDPFGYTEFWFEWGEFHIFWNVN